jgi:methionine-gamma-lyase
MSAEHPRPDKHDHATLTTDTWAVHGGNRPDQTTGAIRTPIVMANSYLLPEDPTTLADDDPDLLVYTRESGANQLGLQAKLAANDHGDAASVFGTGMAALHAAFFTVLNPGDHAIVSNVVYVRTWGLFDSLLPAKLGIEVDFVDITDLEAVRAAVRPNTRLIHTEVIANPDLRVADIPSLARIAHSNDARLTVDSTFTPPPLARPLALGADLVIHSLTKYINGHGDAMGGAVIGSQHLIDQIKLGPMHHIGGAISPFNAWLIMRGSVTLPLRLRRHCENAHTIATFLAQDPRVSHVAYPASPTTPSTPAPPPNSPAATEAWSPSPSPARTSTVSASSTTCVSSPRRYPWATTRHSSPTSTTPKSERPALPRPSANTDSSDSQSASNPHGTSARTWMPPSPAHMALTADHAVAATPTQVTTMRPSPSPTPQNAAPATSDSCSVIRRGRNPGTHANWVRRPLGGTPRQSGTCRRTPVRMPA